MLKRRSCGVLLHPTSLPGREGIGTLGGEARRFIDLLSSLGMAYWQILPLTPPACGNSPYSAFSAFAGNPLLIDLDQLVREGDLTSPTRTSVYPEEKVDFSAVSRDKPQALRQAAETFLAAGRTPRKDEFWHFCDSTGWLHDYALFMALKKRHGGKSWHRWPKPAALLAPGVYEQASVELGPDIGVEKYIQWQFHRQWMALRAYAHSQGIRLIGDIPIFVAYDSADVWSNRGMFLLNPDGAPREVAGVPPDYFSKTGQLWGNPLYDWRLLEQQGYAWWIERFRQQFAMFDVVRIDHFRGFEAAWHVPATEKTAVNGSWVPGPGAPLFRSVLSALGGSLPIIAEDLGVITPEVDALRDQFGFPGMKILQFAFGSGPDNPYLPHNHTKNCVLYTGTHDNDTTLGWYDKLPAKQRAAVQGYLGSECHDIVADMTRSALMSVADTVILPFQDLLALPGSARMNIPGTAQGNWEWRFTWDMISRSRGGEFSDLLECYGRRIPRLAQFS